MIVLGIRRQPLHLLGSQPRTPCLPTICPPPLLRSWCVPLSHVMLDVEMRPHAAPWGLRLKGPVGVVVDGWACSALRSCEAQASPWSADARPRSPCKPAAPSGGAAGQPAATRHTHPPRASLNLTACQADTFKLPVRLPTLLRAAARRGRRLCVCLRLLVSAHQGRLHQVRALHGRSPCYLESTAADHCRPLSSLLGGCVFLSFGAASRMPAAC